MRGPISNMSAQMPIIVSGAVSPAAMARGLGAYPVKAKGKWRSDLSNVAPVIDGYFERSNAHVYPSSFMGYGMFNYLINEHDFPSAIDGIQGRGGAYVGVGPIFGFTYAAWQGATHSWAIDCNRRVPFGFVPLYGALLSMSRNRLEFLSLISGRPMPEERRLQGSAGSSPEELVGMTRAAPFDQGFHAAVSESVIDAIVSRVPFSDKTSIVEIVAHWMNEFRKSFEVTGAGLRKMYGPHSVFVVTDDEGRGGTISSEEQFYREREIFLEGRITGIAAEIAREGMDVVESAAPDTGGAPKVAYISNVEDHFFINHEKGGFLDQYGAYENSWSAVYLFYKRLQDVIDPTDAMLVSALCLRLTTVQDMSQYVKNAIPLQRPVKEAAETAFDFYRLRRAIAREHRAPMEERIERVLSTPGLAERFPMILGDMDMIFDGAPLHMEYVRKHLSTINPEFRILLRPWEREMLLRNLVDLGIIQRPDRYQSFLKRIEAR